ARPSACEAVCFGVRAGGRGARRGRGLRGGDRRRPRRAGGRARRARGDARRAGPRRAPSVSDRGQFTIEPWGLHEAVLDLDRLPPTETVFSPPTRPNGVR